MDAREVRHACAMQKHTHHDVDVHLHCHAGARGDIIAHALMTSMLVYVQHETPKLVLCEATLFWNSIISMAEASIPFIEIDCAIGVAIGTCARYMSTSMPRAASVQ